MNSRTLVCAGCTCLCEYEVQQPHPLQPVEIADCPVASKWFLRESVVDATIGYPYEELDQHLLETARMLASSRQPLITGIENLTIEAQQAAVKVADRFFAGVDSGWSLVGRGSMASFQRYGKVTATLGEIANRSDLVVIWFADPMLTHPRFAERFIRNPNKPLKKLIVIDSAETETTRVADQFIQIANGEAASFVQALRKELAFPDDSSSSELLKTLTSSQYGAVFVGKSDETDAAFDVATDQWFQLVRSLNDVTRFVMGSLRNDRNGLGANNVLASLTGFPNAVRFSDSGPSYNGIEFSTQKVLERRECDLLIACDAGAPQPFESNLDASTISWLRTIPVIAISDFPARLYSTVNHHLAVGTPGQFESGDFARMDDILIPLTPRNDLGIPSSQTIFERLLS